MTSLLQLARQTLAGLLVLIVMTVVLGVVYPLAVTAYAAVLGDQADRQLLVVDGEVVGSAPDRAGVRRRRLVPLAPVGGGGRLRRPRQRRPRTWGRTTPSCSPPSRSGAPRSPRQEGVDPADVPPDALTASASGLDPDISPEYARLQVDRVASERDLDPAEVRQPGRRAHARAAPWGSSASRA